MESKCVVVAGGLEAEGNRMRMVSSTRQLCESVNYRKFIAPH